MEPLGDAVPVVVIGGGPVGLSLALGLAHHGVRSVVVERDPSGDRGSRAFGIWGRTLEVLEDWNLERPFLDRGDRLMAVAPVDIDTQRPIFTIDFSLLADESSMPGMVLLPQAQTELTLREAIEREPLARLVDGECVEATQDEHGVTARVRTSGGEIVLRGLYLVGADGSRSVVREGVGMRHAGTIIPVNLLVFDVEIDDDGLQPIRLDRRRKGLLAALRLAPGRWRVLMSLPASKRTDGAAPRGPDIADECLSPGVDRLFGRRPHRVVWQSQTTLHQQRIPTFRVGRIVFAGDSAHLISPAGGQGMNQGMQDAENLAWTLAAVVHGADPDAMLDGFDGERGAVADVVRRRAYLNSLLEFRTPVWLRPFGFWGMRVITRIPPVVRLLSRRLSMRDLRYRVRQSPRLVGGHRAVGRRMPDVVLASGARLAETLAGRAAVVAIGTDVRGVVPSEISLVRLERSPARLGLRAGSVAIVRPDRHIGAVLRRPGAAQVADALERACGVVPATPKVTSSAA